MKHLYYATSNEAKFSDAKLFLESTSSELKLDQLHIDIPEVQSDDHNDILLQKVEYVRSLTNRPFIVDDASFYTERFPKFPGAYTKFVNETLGREGWERLFENGDIIHAVARVALHNFGDIRIFDGEIEGRLHFDDNGETGPFSLNDHIVVGDGRLLRDAIEDPSFVNHRRMALGKLTESLSAVVAEDTSKKEDIGRRWSSRASEWGSIINNEASYVNHEHNYERVNLLIQKYAPLAEGKALEVGCGTGEAGRILKTANPDLTLVATDISEGMLSEAREQTAASGLDIEYKQLDITNDELGDDKYGIIISRGVVVSHLPKSNIYDFLESAATHTDENGYLLFDFIQHSEVGEIEKPVDSKNEFSLDQMDEIMSNFNMERVDVSGTSSMRVLVVCYRRRGLSR